MGLAVISYSPNTKTSQVLYCREFSAFQVFAINPDGCLKTLQWDTSARAASVLSQGYVGPPPALAGPGSRFADLAPC